MTKKIIISLLAALLCLMPLKAFAYWVWTPETGKWINPKYAVKDSPEEQFDFAMGFYKGIDYKRAIGEFQKLLRFYPKSELAPTAQYYVGRSHEDMEDYYKAYLTYQKTIDTYPFTDKIDEIVEREYRIGNLFLTGHKTKILGMALLPATDKAVEIFRRVADNAPYGKYAPLAQFKIGETYKKEKNYGEAIVEFQKLVDSYPESELVDDAKYEIAFCTYKASLDPAYDQTPTDTAMQQFEEYAKQPGNTELSKEGAATLRKLKERKAENIYQAAYFYDRQKHYESAIIYYNEILSKFPDTDCAVKALSRLKIIERKVGPNTKK
ncbi:MAG: hypothetical protein COS99_03280 [Candidatus Omnitrophica bacterium CG07_land_8_20_14_0_80_42_15]|uniref:Outer membrane lipoprotein BamD-like domain-containing protein n=1 Tax=Candidatus Aquitaenariimonas noxiae TaxID=1974741 RepID=A0A2J0KTK4_9BACT|nr:MAG: hypothetical protein COS99_03280 [Candidatus Omnitrophica bacterium CG07_land_8_20_14_0_80_42_15]